MELDHAFELAPDDSFDEVPPIFELPAPRPFEPPDPAADTRWMSLAMIAVVAGLGGIKLALFAMGTSTAMIGLGVVFVLAHTAAFAGGASWFWDHRYA